MPTYKITDPQSGKTLKITGDSPPTETELNQIFKTASEKIAPKKTALSTISEMLSPSPVGGIPKIIPKVIGKALNLPSNIMGGGLKASKEYLSGTYTPPQIPVKIGEKSKNLGELIHPTIVGAARGITKNQSIFNELPSSLNVKPESIPGMAIGLAGEIATPDIADALKIGEVATTLLKKGGKTITELGEKTLLKALKPSPSQLTKFAKETGEELVDFMARNEITSDFVTKIGQKIDELQEGFDEIAVKSGKKVGLDTLNESFDKVVKDFNDSVLPEMKSKAALIGEVKDAIIEKYGEKIDVSDLTDTRRQIDKLLKEGQFSLPVEQSSYLRAVRNAIQDSIQIATKGLKEGGKGIKEIGIELKKAFKFEAIAEKQKNLGKGANPLSLTKLLGMITGGTVQGIPGIATGYLAATAAQSDKVLSAISKGLSNLGSEVSDNKTVKKLMELLLKASKEGLIKIPQ